MSESTWRENVGDDAHKQKSEADRVRREALSEKLVGDAVAGREAARGSWRIDSIADGSRR